MKRFLSDSSISRLIITTLACRAVAHSVTRAKAGLAVAHLDQGAKADLYRQPHSDPTSEQDHDGWVLNDEYGEKEMPWT